MESLSNRHLAIAIQPVHIGAGTARSGIRTIARNDSDGLPVLPASSLKGCARALSHFEFALHGCDGKGRVCPQPHRCASCSAFGYANVHDSTGSLVRFSSGELILAPWHADRGPMWLSTLTRLRDAGILAAPGDSDMPDIEAGRVLISGDLDTTHLLSRLAAQLNWTHGARSLPAPRLSPHIIHKLGDIGNRLIVLDEDSFAQLAKVYVNTSASIGVDSRSDTARRGALYSLEAVGKGAVFCFSVLYLDPSYRGVSSFISDRGSTLVEFPPTIMGLTAIVWAGLKRFEVFGIGGRRSRGFGRLRVLESHDPFVPAPPSLDTFRFSGPKREKARAFISYDPKDAYFARRLVGALQKEGISSWLDLEEILVGDSIAGRIQEGLENCQFVVAVLSKNSTQSKWMGNQLDLAFSLEDAGRILKVLPVVIDEGAQLPMRLHGRAPADFSLGFSAALSDLTRSIKRATTGGI